MPAIPAVAVAALLQSDDDDPRVAAAHVIFDYVVELVRANGMEPVIVNYPTADLASFSGLVLPGGGDLDPTLYGGASSDAAYGIDPAQDTLDLALARGALAGGLPVLGICRGAQVLNVAAGGSLIVHLPRTSVQHACDPEGESLHFVWHPVRLSPSRLRDRLGVDVVSVASGHHQGIDRLGEGLHAVARSADGLVEAFEDVTGRVLGVQWHPEAPGGSQHEQDTPFQALADAIAEVRVAQA